VLYPLDEKKVEEVLQFIEGHVPTLLQMAEAGAAPMEQDVVHRLAVERLIQLLTEAMTDVCALIIDGLMLRDPGSYQDLVEIVTQEGAFPAEYGERLKELVAFRTRLMREYLSVTVPELSDTLRLAGELLPSFTGYVRKFLADELFKENF